MGPPTTAARGAVHAKYWGLSTLDDTRNTSSVRRARTHGSRPWARVAIQIRAMAPAPAHMAAAGDAWSISNALKLYSTVVGWPFTCRMTHVLLAATDSTWTPRSMW